MKKILCLLLVVVLTLGMFAGCGEKAPAETYEVAFVTDIGTVDDKSFNEGTYAGVEAWAKANGKTHKHYQPASQEKTDLIDSMYSAIDNGAKVVVAAGFVFPEALTVVATANPDVDFILLDAEVVPILDNIATFQYSVEDAGWLAGYLSVKEGFKKLSFIGGISFPTVYNAGQGFVQGADAAAKELGIDIEMSYGFTGNFSDTPDNKIMMTAVLSTGTEVLFSFGGGNTFSAFAAASEADPARWVITPDVDGTSLHDTALTSVMKELAHSVEVALDDIYNNEFKTYGGKNTLVGINEGLVGLPFENSKFEVVTKADYDAAVELVKTIDVIVSADANKSKEDMIKELGLTNTTVTFIS